MAERDLTKMSTDELVDELLKHKIEDLKGLQVDSPEFKDAMNSITELYKAQTDAYKLQVEADYKQLEASGEKRKGFREWSLGLLGIAIPTVVYALLWRAGMRFEETGTISSSGMRRLNSEMKLLK